MSKANRIPAAIYVRISQDRSGAGLGVERQEQDCRKLAESLGWRVAQVFCDNDTSAYSGRRRPQYEALLAAIEAGEVKGVLAWHPDRLHRSPRELETYIDTSERHGAVTHTVQTGIWDLSTPSGRMLARQLGAVSRYESEHKGERIRRAREQQAKAGRFHGGIRPFGFESDGVTVRPVEAAEVVKMVESVVGGISLRSIVRDLNERGVLTATGKPWRSQYVRELICAPRIAGLSVHHGEIAGIAVWPALVPRETWEAARHILNDPRRRTNPGGGPAPKHLGSGIYICGVCGERTLRVGRASGQEPAYRCGNRDVRFTGGHVSRRAAQLDGYVEAVMVERLSRPGLIDSAKRRDDSAELAALRTEQDAIRLRLEQLAEAFADGEIDRAQLAAGTKKLTARDTAITATLAHLGGRSPLDFITDTTVDIPELWQSLTMGQRRAVVDYLADVKIVRLGRGTKGFSPEGVKITWKR
ncbi:recombinase family protein [Mycolicibacterium alvei]|uniref:Serine recombinase n=1 Tax=Mycolicibacterium alvei TaxID=67081 RepID=A0A6N4UQQ9_9MYCO|nr:recombinase family protein [Mycolicibacterium alvei]MCV7004135.1 recombinase family protein [Mycolicibacterium alvei]BBX25987.1 serine recombinase [Mycolicibacterium alvei]